MKQYALILLIFTILAPGIFAQGPDQNIGEKRGSLIYLDGVNILNQAEIDLKKDQLLLLETFDLMPQSNVQVRARSGPTGNFHETFLTDDNGAIHEILFFPKKRSKIKCTLWYTTKDGKDRKHNFSLQPVQ